MTQTRTNTPRCTLLIAQARTDTPRCTLLIAQARTDTPRCTLLMTQTRTNTPRCTLWVAQARVNTPQCYFKVRRAGRTPYLYSSREFTEHLRTFLKIQKNCVLRALLPFGGHLATFHKDAFRFLHRNSSYICPKLHFFFFYLHAVLFHPVVEDCKRKRWTASRLIIKKAPGCPNTT